MQREKEQIDLVDIIFWLAKPLSPEAGIPVSQIMSFHCTLIFGENFKIFHIYKDDRNDLVVRAWSRQRNNQMQASSGCQKIS